MEWANLIMYKEGTMKIIRQETTAVRKFGRPRLGGEDDVRVDLGKMKTQNWNKMAMDKDA
jgi:hypothetical protein